MVYPLFGLNQAFGILGHASYVLTGIATPAQQ